MAASIMIMIHTRPGRGLHKSQCVRPVMAYQVECELSEDGEEEGRVEHAAERTHA